MKTVIVLELTVHWELAAQLHIKNGSKKLDKNSLTFKIFMYLFYFILLESAFTTLVAILQPLTLVNCSLLPTLR